MPAESIPPPIPLPSPNILSQNNAKCSHCGGSGLPSSSSRGGEEVIILDEEIERVCAACWRAAQREEGSRADAGRVYQDEADIVREASGDMEGIGLGLEGMHVGDGRDLEVESPRSSIEYAQPVSILPTPATEPRHIPTFQSHSLPSQPTRAWTTHDARISPIKEERTLTPPLVKPTEDRPSNPLLDVTQARVSSSGRGALYPGSVFKGTQTSGRSAYDVEVRFVDVNIPESTVSGHLSISHLTDTHPHLTTFFTGEIIGPKYGFITGPRFGATEHDDMRHWGRFEQFRRPSTRADMIRPDLLLRDPTGRGADKRGMERDFVFLRIKERFLVPDHTVRDISGASFAGFYFAMIDLNPNPTSDPPLSPTSPTIPKTPLSPIPPISPTTPSSQYFPFVPPLNARRQSTTGPPAVQPIMGQRRMSGSGPGPRSPGLESGPGGRRRRESMGSGVRERETGQREATIRGYYFHSLNQEPFQELFLTHIPNKSCGAFEMR